MILFIFPLTGILTGEKNLYKSRKNPNVRCWISSLWLSLAMYSRLPVPKTEWREENQRYLLAWFPAVGLVEGVLFVLLAGFLHLCHSPGILLCAVLTSFPIWFSGGIHMDGFLDTLDALGSWKGREERLQILKDSHVGAAAVIGCGLYLLLYSGGVGAIAGYGNPSLYILTGMGFVVSRSLSGLCVLSMKRARPDGLAHSFAAHAGKAGSIWQLGISLCMGGTGMWLAAGLLGGVCLAAAAVVFIWFYIKALKIFGGITGDLAGYFLQICELAILYTAAIGGALSL